LETGVDFGYTLTEPVELKTFIALDLETTGLDPERDEIFEVAAVKFRGEEVLEIFHSLVNPKRKLSPRVRLLCGVAQSEVDRAPPFSRIAEKISSFLGDFPLVGHNISFDLDFLRKRGIEKLGPAYDTLELVRIFLPRLPQRNLPFVASYLEVPHPPAHRALDDALATKEVFTAILKLISELDEPTFRELLRLSEKADAWLSDLLHQVAGERAGTLAFQQSPIRFAPVQPLRPSPQRRPLDLEKLTSFFRPGGALTRSFPRYEYRSEQVRMMREVAHALSEGRTLLVEAGTGVGKSLAYLLPAAIFALENNTPVVISTNTINLQEQLLHKDIPALTRALEEEGFAGLRALTVKGRSNYLCPRRLDLIQADELSPDMVRLLMKVRVWLPTTRTGDRAELNLNLRELKLWERISAQASGCPGRRCPHYESCFALQARQAASAAHLIIVNHALLFSELASGGQILPEQGYLIIDEAHHLEDEATKELSREFSEPSLQDFLQYLTSLLSRLEVPASRKAELKRVQQELKFRAEKVRSAGGELFGSLQRLFHLGGETQDEFELRLTPEIRSQPAWSKAERAAEHFKLELDRLSGGLDQLYGLLEDLAPQATEALEGLKLELLTLWGAREELAQALIPLLRPEPDWVLWLSHRRTGELALCSAPLHIGEFLRKSLFAPKKSVVLTGATLSLRGSFQHFRERVGLREAEELLLDSPYDWRRQALLYLPQDIPEPGRAGYQEAVERVLLSLCHTVRGRTLILFTSHAHLRNTREAIGPPLEEEGILVLGQGVDGSPQQILSALISNPCTVLLGTASFWEGVDVVGEALSVLVMVRLPFNVPNEPIFAARSETYNDPFHDYALPQAAFRFRQGFGRLIRSRTDRGVVVVLDSRLNSREYGAYLLGSLPPCRVVRGSSRGLPAAVKKWLSEPHKIQRFCGDPQI